MNYTYSKDFVFGRFLSCPLVGCGRGGKSKTPKRNLLIFPASNGLPKNHPVPRPRFSSPWFRNHSPSGGFGGGGNPCHKGRKRSGDFHPGADPHCPRSPNNDSRASR